MSDTHSIKERVLAKIENGEVSMRSRAYFALETALAAGLILLAALFAVFDASFVLFSIRESGTDLLLGFGTRGIGTFFALFPWFSLAFLLALLIAIEFLVRRFRLGYRAPALIALAALGIAAVVLAVLVAATPFHAALLERADRGELPVIGEFYEGVHAPHERAGVYRGVVTAVTPDGCTITHDDGDRDTDDGTWRVIAPAGFDTATLRLGERIFVAGTPQSSSTVAAYGIEAYPR